MRRLFALTVAATIMGGVAQAQPVGMYAEGVAQSAFGNVTSQSYGVEVGFGIRPDVQVFVEGGRVFDVAPPALGVAAQLIAGNLAQTQNNVTYTVSQPVTFGIAGVKYQFSIASKLQPYVLAGVGVAGVKRAVAFSVAGTDVTDTIQQLGIVLGSDLSGSFTKPMVTFGAGAMLPVGRQFIVDFQYRFGRMLADDPINVSRAGLGLGFRF